MAVGKLIHRSARGAAPTVRRIANPSVTAARARARERMQDPGGLMIGGVRDPAEQAADRIADQVMRMAEPASLVRRACAECAAEDQQARRQVEDEEEEPVRMRAAAATIAPGATAAPAPAAASAAIAAMGPGRPLPRTVRAIFEPRFGADFSSVRVHDDAPAGRAARALHARAFTLGHDIAFAPGERAAGTPGGNRLMAHELAHVIQNTGSIGTSALRRAPDDPNAPPPATIVSPVWNVQGRAVVVVESGGERMSFYQRSGGSTRPAGHAGPQLGDWAPFDGFKPRRDGAGHFVKHLYHVGKDPSDPLHGFGDARNKAISAWLGRQQLSRPPERPWHEVQIELERLGVPVLHPSAPRGGGTPPRVPPAQGGAPGRGSPTAPPSRTATAAAPATAAGAEAKPAKIAPAAPSTTPSTGTPGRSAGLRGTMGGAVLVIAGTFGKFALQRWLQGHFAPSIRESARRLISEAVEQSSWWFNFYVIGPRLPEIQKAWAEGRQVRLHVVVDTEWVDTNIGRVMTKAEVVHRSTQLLFGNDVPFPYMRFQPKRGFFAQLFNAPKRTFGWETFDIPLEGAQAPAHRKPE